jgi:hypothetical protein
LLRARPRLLKQIPEAFTVVAEVFTEAQLHIVPRLLTRRCGPAVSHPSIGRPRERTAVDQSTRGNDTHRLECVRRHRLRTGGLTFLRVEVRSRVRVHTPWQLSRKAIVSRHLRITEIKRPQTSGTETPECSSGMETVFGMQTIFRTETISEMGTIFQMEIIFGTGTIIFVVTGKNTFSGSAQGIGIATGTVTAITGGMVTDAASSMGRG